MRRRLPAVYRRIIARFDEARRNTRPGAALPGGHGASRSAAAAVLRLQAGAGNRAVTQLASGRVLTRKPAPPKASIPPPPAPPVSGVPAEPAILTAKDRETIEMQAAGHVMTAFTAFTKALDDHITSIKAEDRSHAEMTAALIEIFFGFAAPMLTNLVLARPGVKKLAEKVAGSFTVAGPDRAAKAKIAKELAGSAQGAAEQSKRAQEAAAKAKESLKEANKASEAAKAKGPIERRKAAEAYVKANQREQKAFGAAEDARLAAGRAQSAADDARKAYDATDPVKLISSNDYLKAGFAGAAKLGSSAVKINSTRLFGESDVDEFGRELHSYFHAGANHLTREIYAHKLTDKELIATWIAYHEEVANVNAYVESLKQVFGDFKKYVRPVGTYARSGTAGAIQKTTRAYWVNSPGGRKRLGIHRETIIAAGTVQRSSEWVEWVPDHMVPFVVSKTVREFGAVESIDDPLLQAEKLRKLQADLDRRRTEAAKEAAERERKRKLQEADRQRKEIGDFVDKHPEFKLPPK